MNFKKIVNFFFELTHLKRTKRSGLLLVGIEETDSVAEHCFVAAQIAYVLAKMENANAEHAATIALFHDNGEARISDLDLVQSYYLKPKRAEKRAFSEQVEGLPLREDLQRLFEEFEEAVTPEAIIARDADRLELAVQVKCYLDAGANKSLQIWMSRIKGLLKIDSAKQLFDVIEKTDMNEWWRAIKGIQEEIKRIKKNE